MPSFMTRGRSMSGSAVGVESRNIEMTGIHMRIEEDVKVDFPADIETPGDEHASTPSLTDIKGPKTVSDDWVRR
jgi:hypothetical protein